MWTLPYHTINVRLVPYFLEYLSHDLVSWSRGWIGTIDNTGRPSFLRKQPATPDLHISAAATCHRTAELRKNFHSSFRLFTPLGTIDFPVFALPTSCWHHCLSFKFCLNRFLTLFHNPEQYGAAGREPQPRYRSPQWYLRVSHLPAFVQLEQLLSPFNRGSVEAPMLISSVQINFYSLLDRCIHPSNRRKFSQALRLGPLPSIHHRLAPW